MEEITTSVELGTAVHHIAARRVRGGKTPAPLTLLRLK